MRRVILVFALLSMAALACNLPGVAQSPSLEPVESSNQPPEEGSSSTGGAELTDAQIDRIVRASVQIYAVEEQGGRFEPLWSGSGTLISPTGEILTNCHVACGAPLLVVLLTTDPDLPPEPTFIAEITHYDEDIDLAILQVVEDVDGNPVSPSGLPYLEIGDSDSLGLGDPIRIFGYPGVGGETITFTSGSVSGFESASVSGNTERVIIKTDAGIASGNSGGTAVNLNGELIGVPTWVNPDVRDGVTIGGIGVLRPVNLISYVRQQAGSPPPAEAAGLPPSSEPDSFEPNDNYDSATGPLEAGETVTAYISWDEDVDVYFIAPETTQTISISLTGIPPDTDYDLYLLDSSDVLQASEGTTSEESIEFSSPAPGTYWIAVVSYSGSSTSSPYQLTVDYDGGGGGSAAGGGTAGTIVVSGQTVDATSGSPLVGGVFGLLTPGVTCSEFFGAANLDMTLVIVSTETDSRGLFSLTGVPRGATYSAFFIYGSSYVCEDGWLDIPDDAVASDLGVIDISF